MWVEIVDQIYCTFNMVGEHPAKLLTLAAAVFTAGAEGKFSKKNQLMSKY
jgi:hypothetical protein